MMRRWSKDQMVCSLTQHGVIYLHVAFDGERLYWYNNYSALFNYHNYQETHHHCTSFMYNAFEYNYLNFRSLFD